MSQTGEKPTNAPAQDSSKFELATFGGGCFWCVEAVFEEVNGVLSVESGYAGGTVDKPSYEQVCNGDTGHAEVCQIKFDPAVVSYAKLLEIFWKTHDPTTLNRQGNDIGTQYRSVIFYHSPEQRDAATKYKAKLNESGAFSKPVVTEVAEAPTFYRAEKYHQDYFANNPGQGYCARIIRPKMDKFREAFADQLKTDN